MSQSPSEKRQRVRLSLNKPVDLRRINLVELEHATLGDLTPEGVFIATPQKLTPGTEVELDLSFPNAHQGRAGGPPATVTLRGVVAWCGDKVMEGERRRLHGIGVKLTEMNAETFQMVVALYERLQSNVN